MNLWLFLAAAWIGWTAIVGPATFVCSSSLSVTGDGHNNNLSVNKVQFDVTSSTKISYNAFLESLRKNLNRDNAMVHQIRLLPAPSGSWQEQDLLFVELFDWSSESITLVLNRTNAYVMAYEAQNRYFLLSDTPRNSTFYRSDAYELHFKGSYIDLQRVANENRRDIDLGIIELAQAVTTLNYWSPPQAERLVARNLIVLIQMVSETARFGYIENRVTDNIIDHNLEDIRYENFRPDVGVMDLETNWGTLSSEVQRSNTEGTFLQPITLKDIDQKTIIIRDASAARDYVGLSLLLHWRQNQASLSPHDSSIWSATSLYLNIRSMLGIAA